VADLGLPLNRLEQRRRRVEELFRDGAGQEDAAGLEDRAGQEAVAGLEDRAGREGEA
jgi:hypothetical protein